MSTDENGKADIPEGPPKEKGNKGSDEKSANPERQDKERDFFNSVGHSASGRNAQAAAAQAYQMGRKIFEPKELAAEVTDSEVRNLAIGGNITNIHEVKSAKVTPGPVRAEDLEKIRAWYVEVAEYDGLMHLLRKRNLLLLRGFAGIGRVTTTLSLLDTLAGGHVCRLDHEIEIHKLTANDLEHGCGYLVELPTSRVAALTQMHLDRLSALLTENRCWCVIIVEGDFTPQPSVSAYVTDCGRPDVRQVLKRRLTWELRNTAADARSALLALAEAPEVAAALGPVPSPAEVVALVDLLIANRAQPLSPQELAKRCAEFIDSLVQEWFHIVGDPPRREAGDRAIRLAGHRIALAVLHQNPLHFVAEAGELLATHMLVTRAPRRQPGRPVFGSEHRTWLGASRGHLVRDNMLIEDALVPAQMAAFIDPRMPVRVLAYVWRHHHNSRQPILKWLNELARNTQPCIWVRAGQAAGLLCGIDFSSVFFDLVDGWAKSDL